MSAFAKRILLIIFASALTACGGGGGGSNAASEPAGGEGVGLNPVSVSGRITYDRVLGDANTGGLDYGSTRRAPLRGALVEAVTPNMTVLASTVTDQAGNYSLEVGSEREIFLRVFSEISSGDGRWSVRVVDNTNSDLRYALVSATFSSGQRDQQISINAPSGYSASGAQTGSRSAAPFAILDTLVNSFALVGSVDSAASFPDLTVRWSVNNRPNTSNPGGGLCDAAGAIGTSFYSANSICLLGDADSDADEYDESVIAHEWGHFFEEALSRSDSFGGEHAIGQSLDLRVAFSEGLATALAGMSTGTSVYRDSMGPGQTTGFVFDIESNELSNPGWFNEGSIQSIVYDLFDAASDGVDRLTLGFGPLFDALTGEHRSGVAVTSIFSLISALRDQLPSQRDGIDAIVDRQQITSALIDPRGSNEANNADDPDVLPIYAPITVNGPVVNLCSTDTFGTFNKLSNGRLLHFTASAAGEHTISANPATQNADAVLFVYQGELISSADATVSNETETLTVNLVPGEYVLEIADFANLFPDENFDSGQFCFDIRVLR